MVAHAEKTFPNECCGAMLGTIDGDNKLVTKAVAIEEFLHRSARRTLRASPRRFARSRSSSPGRRTRPNRYFSLAPRLRCILLEDRPREFMPLVFVRRTINQRRSVRSREQLFAQRRSNRRTEGRTHMAKVLIPTPSASSRTRNDSVELAGATVAEVLGALTTQFPALKKQIFTDEGKLRSFVNVYLNDEDIRYIEEGRFAGCSGRYAFDCAFDRRRPLMSAPRPFPFQGRDSPLFAPPDHAGSRHGGPAQAEERQHPAASGPAASVRRSACIWLRRASDALAWWTLTSSTRRTCIAR